MKIRSVLPLCALLTVGLSLLWQPLELLAVPDDEKTNPKVLDEAARKAQLSSVHVRDNEVFAANANGLFRATLKDKHWTQLPIPKSMPADGVFADTPKNSKHILYFATTFPTDKPDPRRGLYDSTDGGMTWRLISGDHDFLHVLLHRDGALYAIVMQTEIGKEQTFLRWKILRAPTIAVPPRWVDITGKIGAGVTLHGLFEDPDHAGLVCLHGNCIRNYVIHAKDKNYDWEMTRVWDWRKQPESDESFLHQGYSTGTTLHMLSATLINYFDHPFGSATQLGALKIRTKAENFTFAKDAPKVISVGVHFLPQADSVRLLDLGETLDCWAIRVVTPTGERVHRYAKSHDANEKDQKGIQAYRARKDLVSVEVKNGKPYQRSLDLDRLFDFSKPGVYKVLLSYHTGWLADRDKNEWVGSFGGQVFTVTIR